jgi:hypothetical protein
MPKEYWQEWLKWTGDSGIWDTKKNGDESAQAQAGDPH